MSSINGSNYIDPRFFCEVTKKSLSPIDTDGFGGFLGGIWGRQMVDFGKINSYSTPPSPKKVVSQDVRVLIGG